MPSRREFLATASVGLGGALAWRGAVGATAERRDGIIKPPRLRRGDRVALINPSSVPLDPADVRALREPLEGLGLRVVEAPRMGMGRESVADRAADIHAVFNDTEIKGVLPIRGGWGCARLLQILDYDLIRRRPKILMGYSDVGALLVGIHSQTGLVTFHGPMGAAAWVPFSVEQMKRVLFRGEAAVLANPADPADPRSRIRTITPGRARGRLLGGNLTVLASMVGSSFLEGGDDLILFLEEVREPISEIDRNLTQLQMAGILGRVRGLIFGQCTRCLAPEVDDTLTLDRVLDDHVKVLGVPAWRGALIGHVQRQLTLPIGLRVEIDASRGTISLLEPAVV